MPSFPDSVFAPPNRSNGQTADASHMNGVQDELVAIEGGYLNATARLNSSNSTLANLSVTGGSTFGGALVCSSGVRVTGSTSSFGSSVTITSGGLTVVGDVTLPRIPCVRVTNSTAQDIPNGAGIYTSPNWNIETYDSTNLHSTSVNSSRISLTSSGVWVIHAQANWTAASSAGFRLIRILLNDATVIATHTMMGAVQSPAQNITALHLATDTTAYVTMNGDQNSGSTDSFAIGSWFAAEKISG